MQRRGEQIISEEELQQLIRADQNIAWLEEFELGGRSLLNRNSERAFHFSHYTIQEFLVATNLINKNIFSDLNKMRLTDQILNFADITDDIIINIKNGIFECVSYLTYIKQSREFSTGLRKRMDIRRKA